jgi:hypothetical protein
VNGPCQDEESTDGKTINGVVAMNDSLLHQLNYVADALACVQKVTVIMVKAGRGNDVSVRRAKAPTYPPKIIPNDGGAEELGQLNEWGEGSMQERVDVDNDNSDLQEWQGCECWASNDTKIPA